MEKLPHNPPKICKICGGWTYKDLSPVYKKCECNNLKKSESNYSVPLVSEQLAIEALIKIAHPIKYLQDEAIKKGAELDGGMAIAITNDVNFYQNIAIKALQEIANSL